MKPIYFDFKQGETTALNLQRQRRKLAAKLHPDRGGTHEKFVAMEQEYQALLASIAPAQTAPKDQQPEPTGTMSSLVWEALKITATQIILLHPELVTQGREKVAEVITSYISRTPIVQVWIRSVVWPDAVTAAQQAEKLVDIVMQLLIEKIAKNSGSQQNS